MQNRATARRIEGAGVAAYLSERNSKVAKPELNVVSGSKLFTLPADCHPHISAIYRYWLEKRGARSMPARRDIDPVEMPPALLPGICIVDVVPDARRYVYRLVGTHDVEVRGYDPTGRSVLEAFFGTSAQETISFYDQVVASRAPVLDTSSFRSPETSYTTDETLYLPLSDDAVSVNKVLVFSHSRYVKEHLRYPLRQDNLSKVLS